MKQLKAALVCMVILYGVDAFFFGGWYFTTAEQAISDASQMVW